MNDAFEYGVWITPHGRIGSWMALHQQIILGFLWSTLCMASMALEMVYLI